MTNLVTGWPNEGVEDTVDVTDPWLLYTELPDGRLPMDGVNVECCPESVTTPDSVTKRR